MEFHFMSAVHRSSSASLIGVFRIRPYEGSLLGICHCNFNMTLSNRMRLAIIITGRACLVVRAMHVFGH